MNINSYLSEKREYIDNLIFKYLNKYMPSDIKEIYEPVEYVFKTKGKRIRPILSLTIGDIFSLDKEKVETIAVAIELIHNYSLVHDDLPAMDNDDFRRGFQTLHKKFSEDIAILTGDLLLTFAFEVLSAPEFSLPISLINYISKGIGINGLVGGQALDLRAKVNSVSDYLLLNSLKTAKLIELSVASPIFIDKTLQHHYFNILKEIGFNLGLAFQVIDDILDNDGLCNALTYAQCKDYAKDFTQKAIENINKIENNKILLEIANYLLDRKY